MDEEEDDDEKLDEESPVAGPSATLGPSESTPLLRGGVGSKVTRSRSRSRQRRSSTGPHQGNATVTQAVLMVRRPVTPYHLYIHQAPTLALEIIYRHRGLVSG